jgi:hypothetical protein
MSLGQVNLSELYKFDELYWIPSDKTELSVNHKEPNETLPQNSPVEVQKSVEVQVNYPKIPTKWVVIGNIPEQEKQILKLAFSAAPLGLTDADWSVMEVKEIPASFHDFIQHTESKKYIFLGDFSEELKMKFPSAEYTEVDDSKVLIFSRLISSLNDTEKHLKLAFWNHLKALV